MKNNIKEAAIVTGACIIGIWIGSYFQQKKDVKEAKKAFDKLKIDVLGEVDRDYQLDYKRPETPGEAYIEPWAKAKSDLVKVAEHFPSTEVLFNKRSEADQVLSNLIDNIVDYGECSIKDMYDEVGHICYSPRFTSSRYGWKDLSRAMVKRVKDGYTIEFPTPMKLKGE